MQFVFSLDFWTFVVALLALIATVWYGRHQLRLARREAERHPILEVSEIRLLDAKEFSVVAETARQRNFWLDKLAWYEEAKR